jgi:hypothetical protein
MTSSGEAGGSNRIADVRFDERRMYVLLQDGREISVPLWWYPRLLRAKPEQRNNWEILSFGDALHLDVHGFLIGAKAPGATPPVEARGSRACTGRGSSTPTRPARIFETLMAHVVETRREFIQGDPLKVVNI